MEKWPNFFIVGAPRCGTTSLYEYLRRTKKVYMSPVKEPNYFSIETIPDNFQFKPIRDKKKYLGLFAKVKNEKAVGESTVTYLQDPKAPVLIHKAVPNAKIIIMLREPVLRTFSHYLYYNSFGFEKRSFYEAIQDNLAGKDKKTGKDYVRSSMYSEQVKLYLDIFGKKNTKIIIFNDFSANTKKIVKEVLVFLGINEEPPAIVDTVYNQYSVARGTLSRFILNNRLLTNIFRKIIPPSFRIYARENIITNTNITKPELKTEEKNFLKKIFEQDGYKVEKILEKPLPWNN